MRNRDCITVASAEPIEGVVDRLGTNMVPAPTPFTDILLHYYLRRLFYELVQLLEEGRSDQ
jgi:hypothetical protein